MVSPELLHNLLESAILHRQDIVRCGRASELDQLASAIRDSLNRGRIYTGDKSEDDVRVRLVLFLHALVIRASGMADLGLLPEDAPNIVAEVCSEMAAVMIGDLTIREVRDALFAAVTDEGALR